MFGLFRVYLAVAVVCHHVLRVPEVGVAAVFAFFTLSGFLMTTIMHQSYGYDPNGFGAYMLNRILRLFPSYWVAILISLLCILVVGAPFAARFNAAFGIPATPGEWAMNVAMVFPSLHPNTIGPRLFPIVWTLTVELCYYILIGLGATRTKPLAWLFFTAGLGYHLWGLAIGGDFDFHYHNILAGALPFSVGGLVWHYREPMGKVLGGKPLLMLGLHAGTLALCAAAFAYHVTAMRGLAASPLGLAIDLVTLSATIIVSALAIAAIYRPTHYPISKAWDDFLGKFSYPIYLLHLQVWMVTGYLVFGRRVAGANIPGVIGFVMTMALVLAIAMFLIRFVEPAADRIRDAIRAGRTSRPCQRRAPLTKL